jgi:hypothetical protein
MLALPPIMAANASGIDEVYFFWASMVRMVIKKIATKVKNIYAI